MTDDSTVINVTETTYKDIKCELVSGKGWKAIVDGKEILFPNLVDARVAIDAYSDPKKKDVRLMEIIAQLAHENAQLTRENLDLSGKLFRIKMDYGIELK